MDPDNSNIDLSNFFNKQKKTSDNPESPSIVSDSRNTQKSHSWIAKMTGGLIKTDKQAAVFSVVFFILSMVLMLIVFTYQNKSLPKSPTPDLINTPQPREGYIPVR